MTERPISYNPAMVKARRSGIKRQTRRAMKLQPPDGFRASNGGHPSCTAYQKNGKRDGFGWDLGRGDASQKFWPGMHETVFCPHGQTGDRLWVREAFRFSDDFDADSPSRVGERCLDAGYETPWAPICFEADGEKRDWRSVSQLPNDPTAGKLRPSMFMPRWASRGLDEVISVRVERLQDISEADAIAEGIQRGRDGMWNGAPHPTKGTPRAFHTAIGAYDDLWTQINGPGSWAANPWVWVIEFKVITP